MALENKLGLYVILMVFLFVGGLSVFVWDFKLEDDIIFTVIIKMNGMLAAYGATLIWAKHFKSKAIK
ncbi:MAG: hypothetical protein KUG81_02445 [Gammaproteobacteria bacterium]|nr:hypothetical protein [Gammaproteobacteria bacterium]